ncbi:MAG: amino acid adenylation domain-containing protein, partial [bacterium]|nr:amino acid adenylation domain-containing protein [bacterium]
VEELQPQRDAGANPLFQVMFVLQNLTWRRRELPEVTFSPLPVSGVTAKFDLTLLLEERGATIAGALEYSTELFDDTTMERLRAHFQCLLRAIVADPSLPLSQLPLLSAAERHQLLREWNDTTALWARWELPAAGTVGGLVTGRARSTPSAVAMICGRRVLSYGELDARAHRLAHHLKALGVGPEVPVGIAAERGPEVVVGLLGILKAGGVYLPLDPALPAERLAFMLEDTGAEVVLVQEAVAGALPPATDVQVIYLDGPEAAELVAAGSEEPEPSADPDNLAYVIYTSGTTGVPKGVAVSHRQVLPILAWSLRHYPIDRHSRVVQTLSYCFDMGWFELVSTLAGGGTLCFLPPAQQGDLDRTLDAIDRHAVNTVHTTPSFFRTLASGGRDLSGLEIVHLGGEPLSPELVREIAAVVGSRCRIHNGYGPTEAAINSALCTLRDPAAPTVPIGRVTARNALYVVDRHGRPQPAGVAGELRIGGRGVARGYLRRPALTAERFLPNPFGPAGGRLYRTGDRVRLRTDGALEFLGRIDHQVKIRGFRIELGEIEAVLRAHPEVRGAVVLAREEPTGDKRLVAYVAAAEIDEAPLRAFLKEKLPEYMVPWAFALLEELPLTPTGKVDRTALGRRPVAGPPRPEAAAVPVDAHEELLAGIWAEVLGLDGSTSRRLGRHEDFFQLGGHSLLATQVISRIREAFGVELPLRRLFEAPTVARLAERIAAARQGEQATPLPPLRPIPRDREPEPSFAQERLWFLDQLEPGSTAYNLSVPVRLRGELKVAALAASVAEVMRRHQTLRSRFSSRHGRPVVLIDPVRSPLPLVELQALAPADREAEAQRWLARETWRPFDLARGPLLRALLLRLGEREHVFLVAVHHIVIDGWSVGVLIHELTVLYRAFSQHRPSPLAELPAQYADYAHW